MPDSRPCPSFPSRPLTPSRRRRQWYPCLIAAAVALAAPTASRAADDASDGDEATVTRQPYVQLATPSSIHVVWRTSGPTTPVVRFGKASGALTRTVPAEHVAVRRPGPADDEDDAAPPLHSAPEGTHQFEARIDGLEPDTAYHYAVFDGERRLTADDGTFRFRTHPEPGIRRPFRFWVVGDSGTGGSPQAAVHDAMIAHVAADNRPLDLYLHLGDMAYTRGTDDEFQRKFFAMYERTLRHTVVWPAMGNHEGYTSKGMTGVGPYYDAYVCPTQAEAGGVPSGLEAYYSFDFANVHFIVLDSFDVDRGPNGAMATWLEADLAHTTADWIIAYWHHPPYTKGTHDSDREIEHVEMRTHIMPILEEGGVDLVFGGHSHIYERSMLIDGAYDTPTTAEGVVLDDGDGDPAGDGPYRKSAGLHPHNGTVAVVAGHGGTTVGRIGTLPLMRRIFVENGSVIGDIDGNTFVGTMINADGEVRDVFSIVKAGTVTHEAIVDPWQPATYQRTTGARDGNRPVDIGKAFDLVVPEDAEWALFVDGHPPADWADPGFDDSEWRRGEAGFGYGDDDDRTVLDGMRGRYATVYARHAFTLADPADIDRLTLLIRFDDAFIAYLNGVEVARTGVGKGRGAEAADIASNESIRTFTAIPLAAARPHLRAGGNVLAIEGHNHELDSSDFTLHPVLGLKKSATTTDPDNRRNPAP